ncbi:MAG: glutamine synthetase III [Firmicutes bacterium]|nr:glutamine synthetase III [Bacillota bacterium]
MSSAAEIYSSMVFDDVAMEARLPKETYKALQNTIKKGMPLDPGVANVVANAMKDWAIEKGVTHFTHWFQPLTGVTAEKHDSFGQRKDNGKIIEQFSGKELIQGEPDASSFPSGGLRATFEARGYTAWDATSYAFIKDGILCIPTVFCSYGGEALDQKTSILRSMEALNRQSLRILKLFGNTTTTSVMSNVGPEQEYFLVKKEHYDARPDLIYTGRTLFGARSPKGQELDDHYFGTIKAQVLDFMKEVNVELWKLGVLAKTEHNEVAPAQHELATVYTTTNIAADHNQLVMETLKKMAKRHGLVCLLHEKPFAGVNGSGKHNNWSISTDDGINLLAPGKTPYENAQFLLFLVATIKAVDEYQDLLRMSVATAGNDHRLGVNEAPPAIISVFLGDELNGILEAIETDTKYVSKESVPLKIGVDTLPEFSQDTTDRNRTSPFAFTGNKFEFRMLGSASSISCANTVLNTIVAEELRIFADELEAADDFESTLHAIIKRTIVEHKRIIFNGDGYEESWVKEAEARGLYNLKATPDAFHHLLDKKNVELFERHKVYSTTELKSRHDVFLGNYSNVVHIEALTMTDMVRRDILPAASKYAGELAERMTKESEVLDIPYPNRCPYENETLKFLNANMTAAYEAVKKLEADIAASKSITDVEELAYYYKDTVIPDMTALRVPVDEMETVVPSNEWPYPSYGEILYGVR